MGEPEFSPELFEGMMRPAYEMGAKGVDSGCPALAGLLSVAVVSFREHRHLTRYSNHNRPDECTDTAAAQIL
jgi:hypothetical protein